MMSGGPSGDTLVLLDIKLTLVSARVNTAHAGDLQAN